MTRLLAVRARAPSRRAGGATQRQARRAAATPVPARASCLHTAFLGPSGCGWVGGHLWTRSAWRPGPSLPTCSTPTRGRKDWAASAPTSPSAAWRRPSAELLTGLMRLGGDYADMEGHLLRNFRKYAHRDAVPRRLGVELARPGPAPRPADAAARLDLLPLRRAALRHRAPRLLRRRRRRLVRRLRPGQAAPARRRCARSLEEEGANVFTAEMLDRAAATPARLRPAGATSRSSSSSSRRRWTTASSTSSPCSR